MITLSVPPKYSKGAELTVWFKFSDGHKEVLAIGNVLSVRVVGGKYLYTLETKDNGCFTDGESYYLAYEHECTPTLEHDRLEAI